MIKRGEYKGKWYAEIFQSERYVGTRTLSVHEFTSECDMEDFIQQYNMKHLDFDHTPAIYTMAQWASTYVIQDHLRVRH